MAAYIIFEVAVTDAAATDEYAKLAGESLAHFQAKAIVHGGIGRGIGGRLGTQDVGNAGI